MQHCCIPHPRDMQDRHSSPSPRLAIGVVEALNRDIQMGRFGEGERLPTEAAIMRQHSVSRTVVREALSRLQASGIVQTRHGVGTFVTQTTPAPKPRRAAAGTESSAQRSSALLQSVALLEYRIGFEVEAAALAAQRRKPADLREMGNALRAFSAAVAAGDMAVEADFQFHQALATATHNPHFANALQSLGVGLIPRAKHDRIDAWPEPARKAYLLRIHDEHQNILAAIERQDTVTAQAAMRTHLANSRERRIMLRGLPRA